jgi:aspartyl-tRNA(Asn)/glutamyl-tRNA(Gln) amidotransferase subunit B
MPDPDLPPIVLDDEYIENARQDMPELSAEYRKELQGIGIDAKVVEDILADLDTTRLVVRVLHEATPDDAKRIAFWMMRPANDEAQHAESGRAIDEKELVALSALVSQNKLSSSAAKEVLDELLAHGGSVEKIADERNLLQVSDEGEVAKVVAEVLAANEKAASDLKNGEERAIGFLVGQVMKLSHGKANPSLAQRLIRQQLGIGE